ncbi:N-chimaerin [Desmophyllum pertusum]|uniref:N-chimaerin n=1 Tax=Desmophyllum pertusum TaxID=174260 RepID=A0A9W9YHL1_9CNID|nr:N-chimaerin [Desmophyllum pertusum]
MAEESTMSKQYSQKDQYRSSKEEPTAMMETNALREVKPHNFKRRRFKGRKAVCNVCENNIRELAKEGVKCLDCGFKCHTKCTGRIPAGGCDPAEKYVSRRGETRSQKYGEKAANGEKKGTDKAKQIRTNKEIHNSWNIFLVDMGTNHPIQFADDLRPQIEAVILRLEASYSVGANGGAVPSSHPTTEIIDDDVLQIMTNWMSFSSNKPSTTKCIAWNIN